MLTSVAFASPKSLFSNHTMETTQQASKYIILPCMVWVLNASVIVTLFNYCISVHSA